MREINPVKLIGSVTKSRGYFCHARWKGRRRCIKCNYRMLYYFEKDQRYGCKRCRYKFNDFTGTYIGEFNYSRLGHNSFSKYYNVCIIISSSSSIFMFLACI